MQPIGPCAQTLEDAMNNYLGILIMEATPANITGAVFILTALIALALAFIFKDKGPLLKGQRAIFVLLLSTTVISGGALMVMDIMETSARESKYTGLPYGAVIYDGLLNGNMGWKKWKLGNDCFLSKDLGTRTSVLTAIPCPEE